MGAIKKSRAEYWKDWYWNHGWREKVMSKRYINEYERTKKTKRMKSIYEAAVAYGREHQGTVNIEDFEAGANYVLEEIEKCIKSSSNSRLKIDTIKQIIEQLRKK